MNSTRAAGLKKKKKEKKKAKNAKERKCRLCLVHVKYFPENMYFPEMLFSGKENIFKCLGVL